MNVALLTAAGSGTRMHQDIPKQFIHVDNKPVIIYTMQAFQNHPSIDAILVVTMESWSEVLWAYAKQFNITKLRWVVPGGASGQESIRNGVYNLEDKIGPNDIAIIHDGIRPMVDASVLSDILRVCRKHGNGVTSTPYNEQIFRILDEYSTREYIPRETLRKVATPQAYRYDILLDGYKQAFEKEIGIYGSSYTNTMMVDLGHTLYFAAGSDKNIKLTSKDDLELFKAYLKMEHDY